MRWKDLVTDSGFFFFPFELLLYSSLHGSHRYETDAYYHFDRYVFSKWSFGVKKTAR